MANQIGDTVSKGNYFNVCTDETNQTFETKSFYTDSEDVSFADGENAENKVGAIKGITSDFNTTDAGYAASMTAVSKLNSSLADGNISFSVGEDGAPYATYKVGADTVTKKLGNNSISIPLIEAVATNSSNHENFGYGNFTLNCEDLITMNIGSAIISGTWIAKYSYIRISGIDSENKTTALLSITGHTSRSNLMYDISKYKKIQFNLHAAGTDDTSPYTGHTYLSNVVLT